MDVSDVRCNRLLFPLLILFEHCVMMSTLCNCFVRELLILARTWFAFGFPSKTGCDTRSLSFSGEADLGSSDPLVHRTLSSARRTVRCTPDSPVHAGQFGVTIRPLARPRIARWSHRWPLAAGAVGSPDSPVHHRTVGWFLAATQSPFPESNEFVAEVLGRVRWRLTGQSGDL
jgi:hypothetical protein